MSSFMDQTYLTICVWDNNWEYTWDVRKKELEIYLWHPEKKVALGMGKSNLQCVRSK